MNMMNPKPRRRQVAWTLMAIAYVTAGVLFWILFSQPDGAGTSPTERIQPPAEQVTACQRLLEYADEHGIPTGPDDPSYAEWLRLDQECESTR